MPTIAPYGTWRSPVLARDVAAAALRLGQVRVSGDTIYWVEGRPGDNGRHVVVRCTADGRLADLTPPGTNVRTRVHEYGGAAYAVADGAIFYAELADQRIYRLEPDSPPRAMTPPGAWRYADASVEGARGRLVCVREDHTGGGEPVNAIVDIPFDGPPSPGRVLVSGHDFYSNPRLSPDGSRLAWLAWNHPQMPWDGTELWTGEVTREGAIRDARKLAGGPAEAVLQPEWSPDGNLCFLSDRSGWWNFYRARDGGLAPVRLEQADFGRPPWRIGTSVWAFSGPSRLVAARAREGRWQLVTIDLDTGALAVVSETLEPGESLAATPTHAVLVGGSPTAPDAVTRVDLASGVSERLRTATDATVAPGCLSAAETIEFPTADGLTAHAFYYAPRSAAFAGPAGSRPPLIVIAHGGPTGAADARFNLEVQYWTSRGFAVADVNYGGSTGYGRAYRCRLLGQWGVVDVADCVHAARYLVERDLADAGRLVVRGRSAGGFTALAALTVAPGVFRAGTSYYGIADLELARDSHKFESRYLDSLVGPYPAERARYRARSPIHHVDALSCALLLFQGLEDPVVPPAQAYAMADAVRAKGLPVALVAFEGEHHGFRKAATIVRCLEAELAFYGAIFGFRPDGPAVPLEIENL